MKKRTLLLFVLLEFFLFFSCVEDVDFTQAESIAIHPIYDISLIYFNEPAISYVNSEGIEQNTIKDSVNIDIFSQDFFIDNVSKIEFLLEATNSINRAQTAAVAFFNASNTLEYSFQFTIPASTDNQEITIEHIEVLEGANLQAIQNTTWLELTVELHASEDGSTLNENSPGTIKLRSKATVYLNINSS